MRAGTAAALVAYATTALACSFAGERNQRPLPPGHPAIDSSAGAPDAMVPDLAGGRFVIPGGGITVARPGWGARSTVDLIDTMAKASIANGTGPLCYWSWQSLPPPQDPVHNPNWAARGKFNFTAMEQHVNPGSVTAIRDLCTYAVDRLQSLVEPVNQSGVNVFAGVSEASTLTRPSSRRAARRARRSTPSRGGCDGQCR